MTDIFDEIFAPSEADKAVQTQIGNLVKLTFTLIDADNKGIKAIVDNDDEEMKKQQDFISKELPKLRKAAGFKTVDEQEEQKTADELRCIAQSLLGLFYKNHLENIDTKPVTEADIREHLDRETAQRQSCQLDYVDFVGSIHNEIYFGDEITPEEKVIDEQICRLMWSAFRAGMKYQENEKKPLPPEQRKQLRLETGKAPRELINLLQHRAIHILQQTKE